MKVVCDLLVALDFLFETLPEGGTGLTLWRLGADESGSDPERLETVGVRTGSGLKGPSENEVGEIAAEGVSG